jgi:hypothetical protein
LNELLKWQTGLIDAAAVTVKIKRGTSGRIIFQILPVVPVFPVVSLFPVFKIHRHHQNQCMNKNEILTENFYVYIG